MEELNRASHFRRPRMVCGRCLESRVMYRPAATVRVALRSLGCRCVARDPPWHSEALTLHNVAAPLSKKRARRKPLHRRVVVPPLRHPPPPPAFSDQEAMCLVPRSQAHRAQQRGPLLGERLFSASRADRRFLSAVRGTFAGRGTPCVKVWYDRHPRGRRCHRRRRLRCPYRSRSRRCSRQLRGGRSGCGGPRRRPWGRPPRGMGVYRGDWRGAPPAVIPPPSSPPPPSAPFPAAGPTADRKCRPLRLAADSSVLSTRGRCRHRRPACSHPLSHLHAAAHPAVLWRSTPIACAPARRKSRSLQIGAS